jgi:hypothetical protein
MTILCQGIISDNVNVFEKENMTLFYCCQSCSSEFEELEPAPALIEGPLEPSVSSIIPAATHIQEDPLSAFFNVWKLLLFVINAALYSGSLISSCFAV